MEHDSMDRKLSVLLCGALTLALAGCQAPVEEPLLDPTVTVETTAVQAGDLSTQSTYIGTISAEGTASVVSMISGNVEQVAVAVGDTVSAGDLLCRFDDESARLSLQNAQAAANSAQESYNSAVSNVVDAQVGQFRVKAIIDGAQDLPDGLAVELTTTAHQVTGAVLIPSDAMFFESGVSYVYVVQDGKAVRSDVTIGLYTADTIAVTSGLTLGDEVITTWSSSLRDGVSVQTAAQTEDSESAQADPAASGPEAEG